jgi:hypothetical protein
MLQVSLREEIFFIDSVLLNMLDGKLASHA